jgi:hypothetical protein
VVGGAGGAAVRGAVGGRFQALLAPRRSLLQRRLLRGCLPPCSQCPSCSPPPPLGPRRYQFFGSSPLLHGRQFEAEFDWGGTHVVVMSCIVEGEGEIERAGALLPHPRLPVWPLSHPRLTRLNPAFDPLSSHNRPARVLCRPPQRLLPHRERLRPVSGRAGRGGTECTVQEAGLFRRRILSCKWQLWQPQGAGSVARRPWHAPPPPRRPPTQLTTLAATTTSSALTSSARPPSSSCCRRGASPTSCTATTGGREGGSRWPVDGPLVAPGHVTAMTQAWRRAPGGAGWRGHVKLAPDPQKCPLYWRPTPGKPRTWPRPTGTTTTPTACGSPRWGGGLWDSSGGLWGPFVGRQTEGGRATLAARRARGAAPTGVAPSPRRTQLALTPIDQPQPGPPLPPGRVHHPQHELRAAQDRGGGLLQPEVHDRGGWEVWGGGGSLGGGKFGWREVWGKRREAAG